MKKLMTLLGVMAFALDAFALFALHLGVEVLGRLRARRSSQFVVEVAVEGVGANFRAAEEVGVEPSRRRSFDFERVPMVRRKSRGDFRGDLLGPISASEYAFNRAPTHVCFSPNGRRVSRPRPFCDAPQTAFVHSLTARRFASLGLPTPWRH